MKDRFMSDPLTCPACASDAITTQSETEDFIFRSGGVEYPVRATYPVHFCTACHELFLGEAAEVARHAATCGALNRLTPADILALRERRGLSRKAFAKLSGVGEASLARWETGELIQSESNDNLLRLLARDENVRLLSGMRGAEAGQSPTETSVAARMGPRPELSVVSRHRHYAGLDSTRVESVKVESAQFRLKGMALH
jgi:putative zinc finger/helix-turn-helix YgiT family protein